MVHPHVRGEYFLFHPEPTNTTGSSPRAWGILIRWMISATGPRFIPTCVGNTEFSLRQCYDFYGSSPRAWGIRIVHQKEFVIPWFIPTCVGNTTERTRSTTIVLVHPHVRGEYCCCSIDQEQQNGSSPRAWGILFVTIPDPARIWFIPTCVGNTSGKNTSNFLSMVHPHVRGEYGCAAIEQIPCDGSSPRAWGIRDG